MPEVEITVNVTVEEKWVGFLTDEELESITYQNNGRDMVKSDKAAAMVSWKKKNGDIECTERIVVETKGIWVQNLEE